MATDGDRTSETGTSPKHHSENNQSRAASLYRPLDRARDEIRLLDLLPSDDEAADIHCYLDHYSLSGEPTKYTALSYTWGDPSKSREVFVDGVSVQVTINLEAALRAIRVGQGCRRLWIDALCINQRDFDERSQEVLRMRSIYASAHEVLAWLGIAAEDSDIAMDLMNQVEEDFHKSGRVPPFPWRNSVDLIHDKSYMAMINLFSRPYWQRVWTMQETAVAKNLFVCCGRKSVTWNMVAAFMPHMGPILDRDELKGRKAFDDANISVDLVMGPALARKRHRQKNDAGDTFDLLSLLLLIERPRTTDPRDRIYGLLGLANDGRELVPEPSYSLSTAEVYTSLTKAFIQEKKDLRIICLFQTYVAAKLQPPGHESLSLPSWVPDWQLSLLHNSIVSIELANRSKELAYSATGTSLALVDFPDASNILKTKGYLLDTIDGLGWQDFGYAGMTIPDDNIQSMPHMGAHSVRHSANQPTEFDVIQPTGGSESDSKMIYNSHGGIFEAIWRSLTLNMVRSRGKTHRAPEVYGLCVAHLCEMALTSEMEIASQFRLWLYKNKSLLIDGISLLDFLAVSVRDYLGPKKVSDTSDAGLDRISLRKTNELDSAMKPFLEQMQHFDFDKRLVVTKRGYIGKVPGKAQKGDPICLLPGCSVPVVLRERVEGGYTVVGESYIHGVMEGEVWLQYEGLEPQTFSIH